MRAALYARFSKDGQSAASIPDQLHDCRRHAERLGAVVVQEFSDAAISGWAAINRPGLQSLLAAARDGAFDLVVTEHLERLSRSGGGTWDVYEDLKAEGVAIDTVMQGKISTMHVGMSGTMSAVFIEDLGHKTRRGQAGVVRAGRSGGGLSYGYRVRRELDARGELIRGLREIDAEKGPVVVRIFEEYAAGKGPRSIAAGLNLEGIPGPTGGAWNASTIAGNAARGNGVIHNALYTGATVWGRHAWVKDRHTGKRRQRRTAGEVVEHQDEALRIIPADLWDRAKARYAEVSREGTPRGARRPQRLLSGLLRCGLCDGRMIRSGPAGSMVCQTRRERGPTACDNNRSPGYDGVEQRVLESVKRNLLHPAAIEAMLEAYRQEAARDDRDAAMQRVKIKKELGEVIRRAERLVDQMADGVIEGRTIAGKLRELEARRDQLEASLDDQGEAQPVVFHPGVAGAYRKLIEDLGPAMADTATPLDLSAQKDALRRLVKAVRITPMQARGQYALEVVGDLAALLQGEEGGLKRVVGAGARTTSNLKPRLVRVAA